ncbi:MAG: PPOX class F420-dependent oxidoreductase [Gammaproteobacteria bacterium]|nr:PPOX class F420-dependent oxidoreductase [Gammaproteobacteria bacterium]MCP5199013.1 PPOX class F420-dependent oxidoreductase [Gammaproteobacteria bacterium]
MAVAGNARYLNLATWRRDGREVRTPVWFALLDGRYYCFSADDAGKVKRLRNSDRAAIAHCNARGGVLGAWQPARATLVDEPAREQAAYRALRAKYGWQMALLDLLARLGGRYERRAMIEIVTVDDLPQH